MQLTLADLERLEALFQSARKDIRWSGMCVEYPDAVTALMLHLVESPWCDFDYEPSDARRILGQMATADLAEVRSVLTAIHRSERFGDGSWQGVLDDSSLTATIARARDLLAG